MSDRVFLAIGTPGGQWCAWLDALLGSDPTGPADRPVRQPGWLRATWSGRSGDVLVDGQLPDGDPATIESWVQRLPDAHWLVMVERPAPGLAAALAKVPAADPAQWLQDWCDGARKLLLLAQRDPVRCLLVDAEEAVQHPDALVAGIQQRFGADAVAAPAATDLAPIDPLSTALAESICMADVSAAALFAELQASCVLLAPKALQDDKGQPVPPVDPLAAARSLQALRLRVQQAEDELTRRAAELAAAVAAQHSLQQQLATRSDALAQLTHAHQVQAQALQDTQAGGAGMQRDIATLRQEGELLLQQLHVAQEELESIFLSRRETELRLAECISERDAVAQTLAEQTRQLTQRDAALQQQASQSQDSQARLAALQAEVLRSSQLRDQATQALQAAQKAHAVQAAQAAAALKAAQASQANQATDALKAAQVARQASDAANQEKAAALRQLQQELAAQQRAQDSIAQENTLLLQQLHQVQEELEQYFLECQRLQEAAAALPPAPKGQTVVLSEVLPLAERDTPPHRELTFQLRGVVVDGREIPEATVRLVEHHGHPGLAVFGNVAGEQLLSCWRETGQEDGRPYMLLVPADAPVKAMLDAMGPADWQLMLCLPDRLVPALAALDPPLSPQWQQLARRFQLQLQVLGRRFRYRQALVAPVPGAAAGALAVRFDQVHWGAHQLPHITAHWQPDGPQAGITLLNDADVGPPLSSWPADAQGVPVERWHLPLGQAVAKPAKRAAWAQLGVPDRDFMLAMLEIWPQALARAAGGGAAGAPAQQPAAQALLADASQALGPPAGWRAVRRAIAAWRQA